MPWTTAQISSTAGAGMPGRSRRDRPVLAVLSVLATAMAALGAGTTSPASADPVPLFSDTFDSPAGTKVLLTNEYAYWNPNDPSAVQSPAWDVTSGSLFAYSGRGWTGKPDTVKPNATSSNGTNSAVFRLRTDRADFRNVDVRFSLWNWGLVEPGGAVQTTAWDGVHVFLRYLAEDHLYYASVNRRDGTVAIKKKLPGGPINGGTYSTLASGPFTWVQGQKQDVRATVVDNADGSVTIKLWVQGVLRVQATDRGTGGAPITAAGAVGIRGDNCNFEFDNFVVSAA